MVGFFDVFDTRERDYNEVRPFLSSAARTVADALRNAHLMQSLRQSNAALRELVELSDQLDETVGLERLARIAAERLRAILAAEDCDIWEHRGRRPALSGQLRQPRVGRRRDRQGAQPPRLPERPSRHCRPTARW